MLRASATSFDEVNFEGEELKIIPGIQVTREIRHPRSRISIQRWVIDRLRKKSEQSLALPEFSVDFQKYDTPLGRLTLE